MGGSSGWQAEEQYDIMEAEALAKKPEDREPWEVLYLESLQEMRHQEWLDAHWLRRAAQCIVWWLPFLFIAYLSL